MAAIASTPLHAPPRATASPDSAATVTPKSTAPLEPVPSALEADKTTLPSPAIPAQREAGPTPADTGTPSTAAVRPEPLSDEDIIDMEQLGQILELDGEDGNYDFSWSMITEYFDQAARTFLDMEEAMEVKDLVKLGELGHFLKGSSAQLGVTRVQAICENVQHYGQRRDQEREVDISAEEALTMITNSIDPVKKEYGIAKEWLKEFFREKGIDVDADDD
ncbi:histidine-phosphotransfer domain HPT domain-containing protein [Cylindrobasidium torrendii FP15055 ss-10]|uniref:Histidine-phosphotransfer domain HPT domain-containing protein n=1 Tax=Cylindrobasidium torrendii FP15055 ss-10 TaxID=1314674 RepID=A0A0D7BNH2_9AGAR|nr:histidine-phosphotransfer domain HPT domain-containing protein [Cylindrobasidium torrendii FP15055 ss-10]